MAAAVRPVLMVLPAVLNISEVWLTPRYFTLIFTSIVIITAKTIPNPTTMTQPIHSDNASPTANPSIMAPAAKQIVEFRQEQLLQLKVSQM